MGVDEEKSRRIIKAFIVIWFLIMLMIGALALLIALAFTHTNDALEQTNKRLDSLQSIKTLLPISPQVDYSQVQKMIKDSLAALPAPEKGADGKNGKDGASIPGPQGPAGKDGQTGTQGIAGKSPRQIEFDGKGHWKFVDDDEWLSLFEALP